MFAFGREMSVSEARSWYEYLGVLKTQSKIDGRSKRELLVFDILRDDLKHFTGNFNHAYGFTKLVRYKINKKFCYPREK